MYMDNPNNGSGVPGSPTTVPAPSSNQGTPAGQTAQTGGDNGAKNYDELAAKFGAQGQELGQYRQFFQDISPILDKLNDSPELVQAIIDGKVDKNLAQAVMEGRVDIKDAAIVQQAADTVKENLGEKKFEMATPESIQKLIEAEANKIRKEFEEKADLQTFQDYTQRFIEKTPDFQEYADEIDKWLDEHDVSDIEVAYYAVKGRLSEANAQKAAEAAAAERQKEIMANAGGGAQPASFAADGTPLVDKLISGQVNPNSFFHH